MNNKDKLTTIEHIPASEVWKLLDYLEKFAPNKNDKDSAKRFALSRLSNFFTNMNPIEAIQLNEICTIRNDNMFNDFKKQYPNIIVNLQGTSPITKISGWEIKSLALDSVYAEAIHGNTKDNQAKQIIKAATLSCIHKRNIPYETARYHFLHKNVAEADSMGKIFDSYANSKELNALFDSKEFISDLLGYLLYCDMNKMTLFVQNVCYRLDCIINEYQENQKITNISNLDFIKYIKALPELKR